MEKSNYNRANYQITKEDISNNDLLPIEDTTGNISMTRNGNNIGIEERETSMIHSSNIDLKQTDVFNDDFVGLPSVDVRNDSCEDSDDGFDYSVHFRQDARGKHVVDKRPKKKPGIKSMAKVDELKRRGIVYGKKGKRNFKRTFNTKISLKEINIDDIADMDYAMSKDADLHSSKLKSQKLVDDFEDIMTSDDDDDDDDYNKKAQNARSYIEEFMPVQQSRYLNNSIWLN